MRCIFCVAPSHDARSVEHIVPESVGNKRRVLPRGVVCDACNNYFARKVEGPVLSHRSFRNLRARWQVPSKQGVKPYWLGVVAGTDLEVGVRLAADGAPEFAPERSSDTHRLASLMESGELAHRPLVFDEEMAPPKTEMSRFLAKMAVEVVAERFSLGDPGLMERFIDEPYYAPLRNWARRGQCPVGGWPFSQRRIAPEETYMSNAGSGQWLRAGFTYDLFMTKREETYFAFCLYGHEWVINVGGPSVKGYEEWLADHGRISPLVERLGGTLNRRPGPAGDAYYWDGDFDLRTGVEFDQAEMRSR